MMIDIFADADADKRRRAKIDILDRLEANAFALPKPWQAREDFRDAAQEIKRLRAELAAKRARK
jgi:hypothetical protein